MSIHRDLSTSDGESLGRFMRITQGRIKHLEHQEIHGATRIQERTVTAENLVIGTITGTEIKATTITGAKLVAGTITAEQLAVNSITTEKILAEAVTAAKIKAGAIEAIAIKAESITTEKLAALAVTTAKLAAESVDTTKLKANTIEAGDIKAGTITTTEIAANTIIAGNIKAATITTTEIAANTIEAGDIKAGTITSVEIASATITGANIAGSTITAAKISISELSALTANLGTITAGTVTGATLRTAASGKRVVIDSEGLHAFNGGEAAVLDFNVATGNLKITGAIQTGSTVPSTVVTGLLTDAQLEGLSAIKVLSKGTRTNLLLEPSPEVALVAWNGAGGFFQNPTTLTRDTATTQFDGVACYKSVSPGTLNIEGFKAALQVISGKTYTFSMYVKGAAGGEKVQACIGGGGLGNAVSAVKTLTTAWERITVTFTSTGTGEVTVAIRGPEEHKAQTVYADLGLAEISSEAGPVFPTVAQLTAKEANWTGSEYASASIFRPLGLPVATEIVGQLIAGQIAAEAITSEKIKAGTIEASDIKGETITAAQIAALTITGAQIAAETIAASKIVANTITAAQLKATAIDAMTVTGATIRTGASFPSVIFDGSGLLLPEFKSSGEAQATINWKDSGGETRELIRGTVTGETHTLLTWALGTKSSSSFAVTSSDASATGSKIVAESGGIAKSLLDGSGQSDFLQLTSLAKRKVNFGTSAEIAAGATKEIEHGLGVTPVTIQLTAISASSNLPTVAENPTSTKFKIKNNGGVAIFVFWLAIG